MQPRMIAGMFAPRTPKMARLITGYGTPVTWLGLATRLQNTITMLIPMINDTSTCQDAIPRLNNAPAVTYPPTLCTSDIQNAKMLYEVQVCFSNGARSLFANRSSYTGLISPSPARCWGVLRASWCAGATSVV